MIDYAAAKREGPSLKTALTRAKNSGDPVKVLVAVEKAYAAFDRWGGWPDNWHTWNIAVGDAWFDYRRSEAYDDDTYDNGGVISARFAAALNRA
jgi:hypothetical protein